MTQAPAPTWDLDSIFPGGSASAEFKAYRARIKSDLKQLSERIAELPAAISADSVSDWTRFILDLQHTTEESGLIEAFAGCLTSQNTDDAAAYDIEAEGAEYSAAVQQLFTGLEAMLARQDEPAWNLLTGQTELQPLTFVLNEVREQGRWKMAPELESLAVDLAADGYHGWGRLYNRMYGELKTKFNENGEEISLSLGQLASRFSSPERAIRKQAFEKLEATWETRAELSAMALNNQGGFRLNLYKHRGWDSFLDEPLANSRLQKASLDAMWQAVSEATPKLAPYLEAKGKLLGWDRFRWYDQVAPAGASSRRWSFSEAMDFIIEHVGAFSEDMAAFMKMAVDKRWVEAEDRGGKMGGAFCTGTGPHRQSRVFMTFTGTFNDLLTLAHELGHAYHSHVLKDAPEFNTWYPMNLAETASIFSETVVLDAALAAAQSRDEKLLLLDQKLLAALAFFCNLHARYLFDVNFYTERANGPVPRKRLNELMVQAQQKAFGGMLAADDTHPLFWTSKLHFFITEAPFYNYPYTFGYLFAGGVYDRALKEGASYADSYRALLADTGRMTSEDLARKHLGVELAQPGFWQDAVNRSVAAVPAFVELVG